MLEYGITMFCNGSSHCHNPILSKLIPTSKTYLLSLMMSDAFTMEMADPDLTSTGSNDAASCNKIKLGNNN